MYIILLRVDRYTVKQRNHQLSKTLWEYFTVDLLLILIATSFQNTCIYVIVQYTVCHTCNLQFWDILAVMSRIPFPSARSLLFVIPHPSSLSLSLSPYLSLSPLPLPFHLSPPSVIFSLIPLVLLPSIPFILLPLIPLPSPSPPSHVPLSSDPSPSITSFIPVPSHPFPHSSLLPLIHLHCPLLYPLSPFTSFPHGSRQNPSPSFLSHHPSFSSLFPLIPLSNYPSPQHFSLSFPSPVSFISPFIPFLSYPSLLSFLSLSSLFSHSSLISAAVAYVLVVSSCYFCWCPC
jgi:hypothetical protein